MQTEDLREDITRDVPTELEPKVEAPKADEPKYDVPKEEGPKESLLKEDTPKEDVLEEDIPEDLKCIICMDLFLNPVVVSCGHTFCKICVQDLIRDKPSCPVCRTPTMQGADNLLPNFTLKNLIERDYAKFLSRRVNNEDSLGAERKKAAQELRTKRNIASFPCSMLKRPIFPGSIARITLDYHIPRELIPILAPSKMCILGKGLENTDRATINTIVSIEQVIEKPGAATKLVVKGIERCRIVNIKSINAVENEELAKKLFDDEKAAFYVDIMDVMEYTDQEEGELNHEELIKELFFVKTKISHYLSRLRQNQLANYLELRNHHSVDQFQEAQVAFTPEYFSKFTLVAASVLSLPSDTKSRLYLVSSALDRHKVLLDHMSHTSADIDPSSVLAIDSLQDSQSIESVHLLSVVCMLLMIIGGIAFRLLYH